jgi:hypothetical protein
MGVQELECWSIGVLESCVPRRICIRGSSRPDHSTPPGGFACLSTTGCFLQAPLACRNLFGYLRIQLVFDRVRSRANRVLDR